MAKKDLQQPQKQHNIHQKLAKPSTKNQSESNTIVKISLQYTKKIKLNNLKVETKHEVCNREKQSQLLSQETRTLESLPECRRKRAQTKSITCHFLKQEPRWRLKVAAINCLIVRTHTWNQDRSLPLISLKLASTSTLMSEHHFFPSQLN